MTKSSRNDEVVEDEKADGRELRHHDFSGIVEATFSKQSKQSKQVIASEHLDVETRSTSNVTEGVGDEGFADTNWAKDDDVALCLDEAKADELLQDTAVVGHFGGLVPALEDHVVSEASIVRSASRRGVSTSLDFIGEHAEQEVLDRHAVFLGKGDAVGESGQNLA